MTSGPFPEATTLFRPTHDASLQQGNPDAVGNWGEVEAKAKPDAAIVGVFKFDVSKLVPSGASRDNVRVSSAKLRIYVSLLKPGGDGAKFAVWSVEEGAAADWDETKVTWNNGPKKKEKLAAVTVDGTGNWTDFDVTEHVSALVTGGKADLSKVTLWLQGDAGNWETLECPSNRNDNVNRAKLEVVSKTVAPPPPSGGGDVEKKTPPPYLGVGDKNTTTTSDAARHGSMRSPRTHVVIAIVVSNLFSVLFYVLLS